MKEQVLHAIYRSFDHWSSSIARSCGRGCNACCTRNVTMTALEGVLILRYVAAAEMTGWFAEKLAERDFTAARFTTNEFALACIEGRELDMSQPANPAPCPFLLDGECAIYPARPFSCRLFISQQKCYASRDAVIPDHYLEATVAVGQLIEHLGQKEYWGNMLDVLAALLDISEFKEIRDKTDRNLHLEGKLGTLTAKPLPGFLISDSARDKITPLLEMIFRQEVHGKTVEDILNGR
jgi:Fe-S-cluster containining protein